MCKHKLKFKRQSVIYHEAEMISIDVWQCEECKKYMIIDNRTDGKISLDGRLGDEI